MTTKELEDAAKIEIAAKEKFAVEKNIPIPRKGRKSIYPWHAMKPGDSFFVPKGLLSSLSSCANNALGRGNYAIRETEVQGVRGVRVWRTA